MIRIVEILIAVNAIAGIAAFLGVRHFVRRLVWGKVGRGELTPPTDDPEEEAIHKMLGEGKGAIVVDSPEIDMLYKTGRCPYCGSGLYKGPQGGMSTNWICSDDTCGAKFNLTGIPGFNNQVIRKPLERKA